MNLATNISSLNENSTKLLQGYKETYQISESLSIFITVIVFVFAVLGFLGNFLTIVAVLKYPQMRDITAPFISSLCLANLAVCVLVLPFDAIGYVDPSWIESRTLCVLVPFFRYANSGVTFMSIAAISLNRYIKIIHHSIYAIIYKKHWIAVIIGFCWVSSYAIVLPPLLEIWGNSLLFVLHIHRKKNIPNLRGRIDRDQTMDTCTIVKDPEGRSPKMFLFILGFFIPTIFIVACYARIFWVVNRSRKKMREHSTLPPKIKSAHFTGEGERQRTEWRILKMILAIFLSFVLCHLPITLVIIFDPDFKRPEFHLFGYLMVLISVWASPIIYGVMNVQYREAYAGVIGCWQMKTKRCPRTR